MCIHIYIYIYIYIYTEPLERRVVDPVGQCVGGHDLGDGAP